MSIASTTITVSGTPTVFLPLPTPWSLTSGCSSNIYLHTPVASPNTFIAWDPLYGAAMVNAVESCLPPQVTAWWQQPTVTFGDTTGLSTALGPEFACPAAYSAVQTVIVDSTLHQTLCCPSKYTMLMSQPTGAHVFPSQCVSTVSSGETFTHITSQGLAEAAIVTVTMTTSALVYAIPVNGFSIPMSTTTTTGTTPASTSQSTNTTTAATVSPSSAASHHQTTSPGVYAGIAVGAVALLALLGGTAWLCVRRRRSSARQPEQQTSPTIPYAKNRHSFKTQAYPQELETHGIRPQTRLYELPERYSRIVE